MSDESSWDRKESDEPSSEETTGSAGGFADTEEETVAGDVSTLGAMDDAGGEAGDEGSHTKLCVYCISEIDALATRCNRCGGYLPPAEGTDFKQHWTLLFCCVAIFIACIWLPIEGGRNDLYASHSLAGGFLTIFAGYGIFASWVNLFHRKMIVWPALFMAMDGLFVSIRRLIQMIGQIPEGAESHQFPRLLGGPGNYVILLCSLLVFWTFMRGAAAGAKKDKERKEAARSGKRR